MDSTLKDEKNGNGEFKDIHDDEFEVYLEKVWKELQDNTSQDFQENQINVLDEYPIEKWIKILSVIASKLENMDKTELEIVLNIILIKCENAKIKIFENTTKCMEALNEEIQIEREKIKMYLDAQQTEEEILEEAKKSQDDTSQENENNVLDENSIENWNEVTTKRESEMELFDDKLFEWRETKRKIQESIAKCETAANKALEIEIMKPKVTKLYLTIKFDKLAQKTVAVLEYIVNRKLEDLLKIFKLQLKLKEKKEQSRQSAAIVNSKNDSMEKEGLELISYQKEIMEIEAEISEMKKAGELLEWGIAKYKEKVDRLNEGKKLLTEILGKADLMQIQPIEPEIASNSLLFHLQVNQPKPTKECHAGSSQAAKNFHDMKDLESEKATPTPSGE